MPCCLVGSGQEHNLGAKGMTQWLRVCAAPTEDVWFPAPISDASQVFVTPAPGESTALFWPLRTLTHTWA